MALYPPSGMLRPLQPNICWDSDLRVLVGDSVVPIHRDTIAPLKSRFLMDLFMNDCDGEDEADGRPSRDVAEVATGDGAAGAGHQREQLRPTPGPPVPVSPPCPHLFTRALHSITVGARPELTEAEFVGFVQLASFLQSDELDSRLCEAALASWRTLTVLEDFRNPTVPPGFLKRFLMMARAQQVMSTSEALDVLALWSTDEIAGGDSVLEAVASPEQIEASELTRLQQMNPRFVELLTPTAVFNIMRRGLDSFL